MPYLYCTSFGHSHETNLTARQEMAKRSGEYVLVTKGTLISGPWLCDTCNARLRKGDAAIVVSCFPGGSRDDLCDYDFAYERHFFAMEAGDTATAYGAQWPDDSIARAARTCPAIASTQARSSGVFSIRCRVPHRTSPMACSAWSSRGPSSCHRS